MLLVFLVACQAHAVDPIASIPVGNSPFALALTQSGHRAVVVNLFPVKIEVSPGVFADGPNVRILDLDALSEQRAFRAGTRLVAIAVTGDEALVVNEDQDAVRVVNTASGIEITQIPVGSRPSNVIVATPAVAVITNGTSGDLSFVDLQGRRTLGSPLHVGTDPRAVALHPNGRHLYVALGGDDAVTVVDLAANPLAHSVPVAVGRNPVALAISLDGRYIVV